MSKKSFSKKRSSDRVTKPKDCPSNRSGSIVVSFSEGFVVVGGYDAAEGPLNDVWRYNSNSGWMKIELALENNPLPRVMFDGGLVRFNNEENIYLFGGTQFHDEEVHTLNDFWKLDLKTFQWKCILGETPVPERRSHIVISAGDGNVIVHGGECLALLDDTWHYDASNNSWRNICNTLDRNSKPCPRSCHSSVFCPSANCVFLFGGLTTYSCAGCSTGNTEEDSSPIYLNDLWSLNCTGDPGLWVWTPVCVQGLAPSPRDLPAMLMLGSTLLILGGYGLLELKDDEVSNVSSSAAVADLNEYDNSDEETAVTSVSITSADVSLVVTPVAAADSGFSSSHTTATCNVNNPAYTSTTIDHLSSDASTLSLNDVVISSVDETPNSSMIEEEIAPESQISDEIEDDIELNYLGDVWAINTTTWVSTELQSRGRVLLAPRRGLKALLPANRSRVMVVITFGGFDGSKFYGLSEEANLNSVLRASEGIIVGEQVV